MLAVSNFSVQSPALVSRLELLFVSLFTAVVLHCDSDHDVSVSGFVQFDKPSRGESIPGAMFIIVACLCADYYHN